MKKYHIYGLGNAMLDIEVRVTDNELEQLGIQKGVMTLVDEAFQQKLIRFFSDKHFIMDCGGSAGNTMIAAQQLGCQGFYSCKVAKDDNGECFLKELLSHGLDTNLTDESLQTGTTGLCLAMVTEDAERTMNTHLGITDTFSTDEIDDQALRQSAYLYMEGYVVTSNTGRAAAIHAHQVAKEAGVTTSITLSDPNMTQYFSDGLKEMIGSGVDILFCNQTEAEIFSGSKQWHDICDYLSTFAKSFLITRGKKGVLLYDGDQYHEIAGVKTEVVDTLGAGDMFAGSYLAHLSQGDSPVIAAHKANRSAARIVEKFGPRLDRKEIKTLTEELKLTEEMMLIS